MSEKPTAQKSQTAELAQLLGLETKTGPRKSVKEIAVGMAKRAWLALAVALVIAVPAILFAIKKPVVYQASARVLLELPRMNVPFTEGVIKYDTQAFFETRARMMKSRYVVEQVYQELQLSDRPEFCDAIDPIGALCSRLQITRIGVTDILSVSLAGEQPAILPKVVNGIVDTFIKWEATARRQTNLKGKEQFGAGLLDIKSMLDATERQIQQFHNANRQFGPGGENLAKAELSAMKGALTGAQIAAEQAKARLQALKQDDSAMSAPLPSQVTTRVQAVQAEISQVDDDLRQLATLLQPAAYKTDPKVKQLEAKRKRLVTQRDEATKEAREQALREAKRAAEQADKKLAKLQTEFKERQDAVLALEKTAKKYADLLEERDRTKRVYQTMAQRKLELELGEVFGQVNVEVMDRATVPKRPIGASKLEAGVKYAAFSLIAGFGLVGFLEYRDRRLRWPDQVRDQLGLHVIGLLPRVGQSGHERAGKRILAHLHPSGQFAEGVRSLFSDLRFQNAMDLSRILMVTSSSPGEGKSCVSVNLAATAAIHDDRVLLVEGDLRQPRVAEQLGLDDEAEGLCDVLEGRLGWRDAVIETEIKNLHVLQAGEIPHLPTETVSRPLLREVLREAAEQYRWVIVDAVPILGVADARIMARCVDQALLVIESNRKPAGVLQRAKETLESLNVPIAGAVLNKVSGIKTDYYYYESHYKDDYASAKRRLKKLKLEDTA